MDVVAPAARAARAASTAGGQVLRVATRAVDAVRPAAKPLHPRGAVTRGVLERFGGAVASGVAWLDAAGTDDVVVRWSRAVGLPAPSPDVFGLAVRVELDGGRHGDLLFSTTGTGPLTRFALVPAFTPQRPMTTLLPYRTASGPVLLRALPQGERTVELAWARGTGAWHPFATLRLDDAPGTAADADVSFDPVLHPLPGLPPYAWVTRLREPAYRSARRARGDTAD
ncbi:hypothetical protein [Angustibacter sp. Root456]|uniref:hypothetical protein n=1 Tax=Angustibacter sp. Root456 TaxID=1736539 RepID=UPI0006F54FE7|nr:hypothetical protein [Angustibacter sp. Root456]KQX67027.1 hypothetical protein ASD06_18020 [Angustibacter sp. Root456]